MNHLGVAESRRQCYVLIIQMTAAHAADERIDEAKKIQCQ